MSLLIIVYSLTKKSFLAQWLPSCFSFFFLPLAKEVLGFVLLLVD